MDKSIRYTFNKGERLCSKKSIDTLFRSGASIMAFPLRIQYLLTRCDDNNPVKVLFSVPKKRFKRAVKRNIIRRRMREAFRLNKHMIIGPIPEGKQLICAFIYIDSEIQSYENIFKATLKGLNRYITKQKNLENTIPHD